MVNLVVPDRKGQREGQTLQARHAGSSAGKLQPYTPQGPPGYSQQRAGEGAGQVGDRRPGKVGSHREGAYCHSHPRTEVIGRNGRGHCEGAQFGIFNSLSQGWEHLAHEILWPVPAKALGVS